MNLVDLTFIIDLSIPCGEVNNLNEEEREKVAIAIFKKLVLVVYVYGIA